ncbi:phosphoribosylformylglycinamidine synthase subunit PurS [Lacticaseibacillus thailandensis]|uniref:Phosphoribosylformylglycinamidine synthase subunit PurS n=1 Tax=Lacticaseibacillus thailandensis DSM 22698 = JCM 13996 TaxID=1423810 RepID=A0A0R2C935_9LACO|nr:phosphoribosylformylglycinamidine synthase subunit PurS [Lacticaseibacillus thailandensis]KRM88367.1 hypothetical protein FD19_GL000661 [Lacticaseibacillus thailandensis DSM 22698 = JCM 13996]
MYKAKIFVNYKPSVLDPQAQAIHKALVRLGDDNVATVMMGKYFELTLTATDVDAATAQVDRICDRLLANVSMETYHFTVTPVGEATV